MSWLAPSGLMIGLVTIIIPVGPAPVYLSRLSGVLKLIAESTA
jgi:hypothetical protein